MRKIILAALISLMIPISASAKEPEIKKMHITAYCPESCDGTVTASGTEVRRGICASSRAHLGDVALIWLEDGYFLGYFECEDTGGLPIADEDVIDIWYPNDFLVKRLALKSGGICYVEYVDAVG